MLLGSKRAHDSEMSPVVGHRTRALGGPKSMRQLTLGEVEPDGERCPTCGELFDTRNGMKIHHKRAHGESIAGTPAECFACGDTFRRRKSHLERFDKNFCSWGCRDQYYSDELVGPDAAAWDGGPATATCDWCGEGFSLRAARKETEPHLFCSRSCYGKWRSENLSGQDSPLWNGGSGTRQALRNLLGSSCWAQITESYRAEQQYTCEKCGSGPLPPGEIDTHHIIPVLAGGTNGEWNLMALCKSCHLSVEKYTRTIVDYPLAG